MDGLVIYIIGAILATGQGLSLIVQLWQRRGNLKAEAERDVSEASKNTAEAFAKLTTTISQIGSDYSTNLTKMAGDYSATLTKMIDLVDSRENKIDELEATNRQQGIDLEDVRKQYQELVGSEAIRDSQLAAFRDSLEVMRIANGNQANEIITLKADVLTLQREGEKKDSQLAERDRQLKERDRQIVGMNKDIGERDERIKRLEGRIEHLEQEIMELKQATPSPDAVKTEEPKP